MAFKPNYRQERGNRERAKEQKKQEKLRKREESTATRRDATTGEDPSPALGQSETPDTE